MTGTVRILRAAAVYGWRAEMAYFANSLIKNVGTIAYTAAFVLFLSVVFSQVDEVAGYGRNEFMLMYLIGQLAFYMFAAFAGRINEAVAFGIHRGMLDYHLLRPRSTLLCLWSRSISVAEFFRMLPVLVVLSFFVEWGQLSFNIAGVVAGSFIFLLGVVLFWATQFILACAGFWFGQSSNLLYVLYPLNSQYFPIDGLVGFVRVLLLYITPVLIKSALAAAVMLGDVSVARGLSMATIASAWIFGLALFVWRAGLRRYTSASS